MKLKVARDLEEGKGLERGQCEQNLRDKGICLISSPNLLNWDIPSEDRFPGDYCLGREGLGGLARVSVNQETPGSSGC